MRHSLVALALILLPLSASALDLNSARAAGKVCEQPDGYVKAISPDATALAAEVNGKRREAYAKIAADNKQSVAVAGQLAHAQIVGGGAAACK